jgi:hypothetical protein
MSWLIVTWFLAFGYVPQQYESVFDSTIALESSRPATVAQLGLSLNAWKRLTISTDIENFQYMNDPLSYAPFRVDYSFSIEYRLNPSLVIIASHECDHVIKNGSAVDGYESQETKILAKLSGQTNF